MGAITDRNVTMYYFRIVIIMHDGIWLWSKTRASGNVTMYYFRVAMIINDGIW
jgi:hypothetical protein